MPAAVVHHRPMGAALAVMGAPPAPVVAAVAAGLGRYPDDVGVGGSVQVHVEVHADASGDPAWPKVHADDGPRQLVVRCGSATATLDYATATATVHIPESLLAEADALRLLVESVFTAALVRGGELYAVHSALVVHDGVGLVLRGPSGAGKSTLTYSCMRRGMGVCSDDWIYAPAHSIPQRFAGYPWRMMMTEDAASRFPELRGAATVPHPAAEGRKVPVVPPLEQQVPVGRADALVLLDPSPELSMRPVSADEALDRFWSSALPTERDTLDEGWVQAMVDRPVFVLGRGTDPEAATQALVDLAVDLAHSRR